jgi:lysozyme
MVNLQTFNRLTATDSQIRDAQTQLKTAGYYHGNIDGFWGPLSEGAWGRWLKDHAAPLVSTSPVFTAGLVVDFNHWNPFDPVAFQKSGGKLVIHKVTEGVTVQDPLFVSSRDTCRALGLGVGGYHFTSGLSWSSQLDNFLTQIGDDPDLIAALDWEDSTAGANMDVESAANFCQGVYHARGVWPLVYGNNLIREGVGFDVTHPILKNCPLWLCDIRSMYRDVPLKTWPAGPTIWQFGEDQTSGVDLNKYVGTPDQFTAAMANHFQIV